MSVPAPLCPVLDPVGHDHNRHSVLFRLFESAAEDYGYGKITDAIKWHAAVVLKDCPCDEGQAIRTACRQWAGQSIHSGYEVIIRANAAAPKLVGDPGAEVSWDTAIRLRPRRTWRQPSGRYRVESERHIIVGVNYILYLAGWPSSVTGIEQGELA